MTRGSYRFACLVLLILVLASCRSTVQQNLPLPEDVAALATTSSSLTLKVSASSDDAEQDTTGGGVALANSRLPFGVNSNARTVGMRFRNVTIPKGATITSAVLELKASASVSGTANFTVVGEAADNTPTYVSSSKNLTLRAKTSTAVNWKPTAWTSGTLYRSVDFKAVVQEVINRGGWQPGNALALQVTGSGTRKAAAFETGAANAAKLIVSYTTTTTNPPPPPPTSGPCDSLADNVTSPWQSQSLSPSGSGKASQTVGTGTFDVCGVDEGYLATGFDEAMHYVSQPLSGNGMITVKVTSLELGAEAGVFLRGVSAYQPDDAAAGLFFKPGVAPQLESYGDFSAYSLGNSMRLDKRAIADAAAALGSSRKSNVTAELADLAGVLRDTVPAELFSPEEPELSTQANALSAPQWLRIKRVNQTVTAYSSSNGTTWQEVGSIELAMIRNIRIGFTAASGNPDKLALGHFENVTVEPLEPFVDVPARLPYPWKRQDIGPVGTPGSSNSLEYEDEFVVSGAGTGTAGVDAQHFVYQDLSGDGTLVTEITSLDSGSAANLQAGLMLRKTLEAGSPYGFLALSLDGTASFKQAPLAPTSTETSRTFQKGIATDAVASLFDQFKLSGAATSQPNRWLMLTREGGTLIGYVSDNNETWRRVGTATLTLDETVYLGLAVSSSSSALATATFQNVSISPDVVVPVLEPDPEPTPTIPEPWQSSDINVVTTPGSASYENDTFRLGGAAAGLSQQSDALHYVYQPLTRDGSLTIHVNGLADNAKVGLSIRNALSPDAEHTSLWLQGAQGVPSFVVRKSGSVSSNSVNDALADAVSEQARTLMGQQAAEALFSTQASDGLSTASHWLRLTRKGNAVGAFTSTDGQTWQQVGYETFDVAGSASIGFWVAGSTGGTSATLNNVSFGNPVGELYNPGEPIEILLNPWSKITIGSGTGETGVRNDNALYSLSAQGGTSAAPVTEFMYRQERSGDALYVSVSELRALEADGAVGLMIRDGLATGSSYAFLKVTPKGIVLETKANGGVSETLVQPARDTLPLWLRIASAGNTVMVYQTQDVKVWEPLGSVQIPLGNERHLGIAARSSGGEVTGAFARPRLIHAGDDTLTGIDSDGNGVRDDVQHYIDVTYPDSAQAPLRDAFTQVARSAGAILTNGTDLAAVASYYNAEDAARQLLGQADEYQLGLLESELFDTPERLTHFADATRAGGQTIAPSRVNRQENKGDTHTKKQTDSLDNLILKALAEECPTGSSPNKTSAVLFGNGIWGKNEDATIDSLAALQNLMPDLEAVDPGDDDVFSNVDNAFAQGDGFFADLNEIAALKIEEILATQYQISDPWNANEVMQAYYGLGEAKVLTPAQRAALLDLVLRFREFPDPIAQAVEDQARQYRELLLAGKRVFVVAHSEGTLLANAARRILENDPTVADRLDSMRILHVASLTDHVEDADPEAYVTDLHDHSVSFATFAYDGEVLPPNAENEDGKSSPWYAQVAQFPEWAMSTQGGHSFVRYYMVPGSDTFGKILDKLTEQVRTTPYQCVEDPEPEDPGEDPTDPTNPTDPDDPNDPSDPTEPGNYSLTIWPESWLKNDLVSYVRSSVRIPGKPWNQPIDSRTHAKNSTSGEIYVSPVGENGEGITYTARAEAYDENGTKIFCAEEDFFVDQYSQELWNPVLTDAPFVDAIALRNQVPNASTKYAIGANLMYLDPDTKCANWLKTSVGDSPAIDFVGTGSVDLYSFVIQVCCNDNGQWQDNQDGVGYIRNFPPVSEIQFTVTSYPQRTYASIPTSVVGGTQGYKGWPQLLTEYHLKGYKIRLSSVHSAWSESGSFNSFNRLINGRALIYHAPAIRDSYGTLRSKGGLEATKVCELACQSTAELYSFSGFTELGLASDYDNATPELIPPTGYEAVGIGNQPVTLGDNVIGVTANNEELWFVHFKDLTFVSNRSMWFPLFESVEELASWIGAGEGAHEIQFSKQ